MLMAAARAPAGAGTTGPALVWRVEVASGAVVAALFAFTLMVGRRAWLSGNPDMRAGVGRESFGGRFPRPRLFASGVGASYDQLRRSS